MRQLTRTLIIVVGCFLASGSINVSSPTSAYQEEVRLIRVMSFNIRYDEPRDKENAWPNRKELVASMIRFHQADIVGVQEALERQMSDLEKLQAVVGWLLWQEVLFEGRRAFESGTEQIGRDLRVDYCRREHHPPHAARPDQVLLDFSLET